MEREPSPTETLTDPESDSECTKLYKDHLKGQIFGEEVERLWRLEDVPLPLNRFEHGLPSETTGFYMRRVLSIDDIIPPLDARYAVAVIRGLHVGYFKSWESASRSIRVPGAVYSLHISYREARLCYMRALIGREVCRLRRGGTLESDVSPIIPLNMTFHQWWMWMWTSWDQDDNLPVPTIYPSQ